VVRVGLVVAHLLSEGERISEDDDPRPVRALVVELPGTAEPAVIRVEDLVAEDPHVAEVRPSRPAEARIEAVEGVIDRDVRLGVTSRPAAPPRGVVVDGEGLAKARDQERDAEADLEAEEHADDRGDPVADAAGASLPRAAL